MKDFAYYDGQIAPTEQIRIPLCDRSYYFGDAVYDAAIGTGTKIYRARDHIRRFLSNCKKMNLAPPLGESGLLSLLRDLCALCEGESFFVYFQLGRHGEQRVHAYQSESGHLLIRFSPFTLPSPDTRLSLILLPDHRYDYCHIKTTNLLPAVLASDAARRAGAHEAVLVRDGYVTECAHSNISVLRGGTLFTHPANCRILPGVMRARLIAACHALAIPVRESAFTPKALREADEVLVSSSSKLVIPAEQLDGQSVGGHDSPTAKRLCEYIRAEFYAQTR